MHTHDAVTAKRAKLLKRELQIIKSLSNKHHQQNTKKEEESLNCADGRSNRPQTLYIQRKRGGEGETIVQLVVQET